MSVNYNYVLLRHLYSLCMSTNNLGRLNLNLNIYSPTSPRVLMKWRASKTEIKRLHKVLIDVFL